MEGVVSPRQRVQEPDAEGIPPGLSFDVAPRGYGPIGFQDTQSRYA